MTEIDGSPRGLATMEGNYASACSNTGHQETDQGLTLSPKISLRKSWSNQRECTSFNKEIDALFEPVQTPHDLENLDSILSESPPKRRRLNEPSTGHKLSDSSVLTESKFKGVSIGSNLELLNTSTLLNFENRNNPHPEVRGVTENAASAEIPNCYQGYADKDEAAQQASNLSNGNDDLDKLFLESISGLMAVSTDLASTDQPQLESPWHESHTPNNQIIQEEWREQLSVGKNRELSNQSPNSSPTIKLRENTVRCNKNMREKVDSVTQCVGHDHPVESCRSETRPISESLTPSSQSDCNGYPSDIGEKQRKYQKLISSFPMTCLLELAGSNKETILTLITELVTYGDYKDSSPNYEIPGPYRHVFDELLSQWSEGTPKNELRKSLIAYIKEKIEALSISSRNHLTRLAKNGIVTPELVNEKISQANSDLLDLLIGESDNTNVISQWIDEVKLMQESSKKLIRYILGHSREFMINLKNNNSKLRAENVQLRTDVQKLSAQLREYETKCQSTEYIRLNPDCSDSISIQSRNESPQYYDRELATEEAKKVGHLKVNELCNELWTCCERDSIAKGQIQSKIPDPEKVGRPWTIRESCINCMRPNSERRYYIIREQVLSMSFEKFKEVVDSSQLGETIFSPTPDVATNKSALLDISPPQNSLYDEVPPLSEADWEAVSAQMTTWPTSVPDFMLDSNATENLVIDLNSENWHDSNCTWKLNGLQDLVEKEKEQVK